MLKYFQNKRKSSSETSEKRNHYESIDSLPVQIWNNINSGGSKSELILSGEYSENETRDVWFVLYNEFIEEFGINDTYLEFMKLKKEYLIKQCELDLTGDRFKNTEMNILTVQMDNLMSAKSIKFGELVSRVSKFMAYRINPNETSVKEFYNNVNLASNGRGT